MWTKLKPYVKGAVGAFIAWIMLSLGVMFYQDHQLANAIRAVSMPRQQPPTASQK